jgi:GNAT superfamily N-acetyltransferase
MTQARPPIKIRPATAADRDFILSLAPRFVEFGPPPWRASQTIINRTVTSIKEGLDRPADTFLIAESGPAEPLGFIRLLSSVDYFTGGPVGYIADVAVVDWAEGLGVGRALMAAAESWATERDLGLLALDVFAANHRVRHFYEALGYQPEVVKYVKPLKK